MENIQEVRMDDVNEVSSTPTTPESDDATKSNLIQEEGEAIGEESSSVEESISNSSVEDINDKDKENLSENKMREIEIEKMVLNCGGIEDKLEKCVKLLEMIAEGRKIYKVKATKRIPAFGISPGKIAGCKVTIRDKEQIKDLLKRFFAALDNEIKEKQITENQVSFGIHEYIEVPGLEYNRDIGILGFEVMLVFKRKGKRVKLRKIKRGSYPKKQFVSKEEIIKYLNKNFGLEVV